MQTKSSTKRSGGRPGNLPKDKKEITLELYSPHKTQLAFHNLNTRYKVAAWGRQSGKSTAALNEILKRAWEHEGGTFWFVSPTYDQARVQYRRMVGMLSNCWLVIKKRNQTELRLKFINNSQIRFVSGESSQNLRGETIHGAVIDEVRDQHPDLWPMLIRPMLATTQGWATFLSTPNGFDTFYDLAEVAKSDATGRWGFISAPSTANPHFSQDEFEQAKRDMSDAVFAQEILAEFRDLTKGKAYINASRENERLTSPFSLDGGLISPHLPICVFMDFNVNPMAWLLGQYKFSGEFYFFDEIWLEGSNTQEAAKVLADRVRDHKPGCVVVGDASGNSRRTASAGKTDYTILQDVLSREGIHYENRTPDSNPAVKDRINCVNAKLKGADGAVRLFFHPEKCKHLKKDLDRVCWKPGSGQAIIDKTSDSTLTHISDAMGYGVYELSDKWQPSPGVLRVIRR